MKLKKIICLFAVVVLALALASCGANNALAPDESGAIKSNGGFVAETADYVYFINGVESYSTEYKAGEVVKGALMRVKKSDFAELGTDKWASATPETVVSKLIVSGDTTAGFYIYGNSDGRYYVYYAVPSTEKDTTGKVKSDKLNFFRAELDGTNESKKITKEDYDSDVKFRFVQEGEKVYLVIYSTSLYVYDAEKGEKVYTYESEKEPIDELIFDEDNGGKIYFTIKPINENLYDKDDESAQQSKYQDAYEYSCGKSAPTVVLSGKGKYAVGEDNKRENNSESISFTGDTIDLLTHKGGYLYYSRTSLDSTVSQTVYARIKDGKTGWAYEEILNLGDKNASSIFADGSYYLVSDDKVDILYMSSTYGLMKYDYTKNSLLGDTDGEGDYGVTALYYSSDIASCSILGVFGDYLYVYNTDGVYYRINYTELTSGAEVKATRINKRAFGTSWYKAEVITVGTKQYLIGNYSDSVYGSYVYAIDVKGAEDEYEEYKTALKDGEDDSYYSEDAKADELEKTKKTLLGVMTEKDGESYEERITELKAE